MNQKLTIVIIMVVTIIMIIPVNAEATVEDVTVYYPEDVEAYLKDIIVYYYNGYSGNISVTADVYNITFFGMASKGTKLVTQLKMIDLLQEYSPPIPDYIPYENPTTIDLTGKLRHKIRYVVEFADPEGVLGARIYFTFMEPEEPVAAPAPENLRITVIDNRVEAIWNEIPAEYNISHYNIYIDGQLVGTTESNTFTYYNLTNGNHKIIVKGVNAEGEGEGAEAKFTVNYEQEPEPTEPNEAMYYIMYGFAGGFVTVIISFMIGKVCGFFLNLIKKS